MIEEPLRSLIAEKFKRTGAWRRNEQGQAICEGSLPKEPGVYLFMVGGEVRYVGSALKSLYSRMKSYERRQRDPKAAQHDQKPTRPVHAKLGKAIDGITAVEVHTLVIGDPRQTGPYGLPINYVIGLEAGLIQAVDPAWNRRGRKRVLDDIDV